MDHCSGTTNVVVSDNKHELEKELGQVVDQLEVGEFFGVMLIPEGVEGMRETRDIEDQLIKIKHNGKWYSTKEIVNE